MSGYETAFPYTRFDLSVEVADAEEIPVTGIPELMAQLLDKLVDNAAGFSTSGQVRIRLHVEDGHALLRVMNDGPGLPDGRTDLFESMVSYRAPGGEIERPVSLESNESHLGPGPLHRPGDRGFSRGGSHPLEPGRIPRVSSRPCGSRCCVSRPGCAERNLGVTRTGPQAGFGRVFRAQFPHFPDAEYGQRRQDHAGGTEQERIAVADDLVEVAEHDDPERCDADRSQVIEGADPREQVRPDVRVKGGVPEHAEDLPCDAGDECTGDDDFEVVPARTAGSAWWPRRARAGSRPALVARPSA